MVLAALGVGESTKVLGSELLHWERIYSELIAVLKPLSTPYERPIKHNTQKIAIFCTVNYEVAQDTTC